MRTAGRAFLLLVALTVTSPLLSAYYYYVFFASGSGPYAPLPAHFDLNAIKDNTVQYFISDQAPGPLMPGDNLTAIYSQIREAAEVWNRVASASLRLHFGGTRNLATPQTVPGIDVVFDDNMPPGIIAQTKLTVPSDLTFLGAKGTTFVPILRSKLQLRKDLTAAGYQQTSSSDAFFMTLVHEFGHSLGLQHTFTSATMSTAITRATTRGAPLATDDVSGFSLLYPVGGYAGSTGSISGQVIGAASGAGINLASVVALSISGVAVSGMTRPDGTYEIDGIPPGQYYIYVHPLPPPQAGEGTPANIQTPADPQNDSFAANTGFVTQFFPGTQDWTKAVLAGVTAGGAVKDVDFLVTPSGGPAVYAMETYGYPQGVAIPAPPFLPNTRTALVFYANGATVNNQSAMAPGLTASIIGSAASIEPGSLQYFQSGFLLAWLDTADVKVETPVAMAVRLNGDLYVLPSAFTVVPGGAPSITAVTLPSSGSTAATNIAGSNLTANTRILLDGAPAQVLAANKDGSLDIVQPPALSGMQATVEAVNPDGQTSLQSLGTNPAPLLTYPQSNAPQIYQTPNVVIAGTDTFMVISGVDTHFSNGTVIGFGSSDISVRGRWVVSPQMVILNLTVDPAARPGTTYTTVATGLEIVNAPYMLTIAAADPKQISLRVPVLNAVTGLTGVPAGGTALIATTGLPADLTGWTLTVGPLPAAFTAGANGVLTVQVPTGLGIGALPVQLIPPPNSTVGAIPGVILQLDPAPPLILWGIDTPVADGGPVLLSASNPVPLGQSVVLMVYGLSSANGVLPAAGDVWMNIGGTNYPVTAVTRVPADPASTAPPQDYAYVSFVVPTTLVLDPAVSNPTVPVMVGTGTRLSGAYSLYIAPAPPPPVTTTVAQ